MRMVIGLPLQQQQPVTVVGEVRHRHTFISIKDVAAFAVAAVDNPAACNQSLPVGGPEVLSYGEAVSMFGRVLSRSIPVRSVGIGEPVPLLPEAVHPSLVLQPLPASP